MSTIHGSGSHSHRHQTPSTPQNAGAANGSTQPVTQAGTAGTAGNEDGTSAISNSLMNPDDSLSPGLMALLQQDPSLSQDPNELQELQSFTPAQLQQLQENP